MVGVYLLHIELLRSGPDARSSKAKENSVDLCLFFSCLLLLLLVVLTGNLSCSKSLPEDGSAFACRYALL